MLADRLLATLDGPEVLDHPSEDHTQTVALVKMFGRCYDTRTLFHLSLRGADLDALPLHLDACTPNLRTLDLSDNTRMFRNMSKKDLDTSTPTFSSMSWPRLHTLHMERCGLESTECLPVLPALLELRLGGNRLESVRALMPLVQCAPILRVLWLVEGNLDVSAGNSVTSNTSYIANIHKILPHLRKLDGQHVHLLGENSSSSTSASSRALFVQRAKDDAVSSSSSSTMSSRRTSTVDLFESVLNASRRSSIQQSRLFAVDLMEKAERATVRVDAASSSWSSSSENVEKRSVDFVLDGFKGRSETDECHATLIASNTSETVSKCKTMLLEPIDNVTSSYSSSS